MMDRDLWYNEDVRRILAGLARTGERVGGDYARGYLDALNDAAAIFGVRLDDSTTGRPEVIVYERPRYLEHGDGR